VTASGYLISISRDFLRFYFFVFSSVLVSVEKIYQTLMAVFDISLPNTSKFVKNTPLCVIFSTLFSVSGNVVKHGLSCLIYHFQYADLNTYKITHCVFCVL